MVRTPIRKSTQAFDLCGVHAQNKHIFLNVQEEGKTEFCIPLVEEKKSPLATKVGGGGGQEGHLFVC